jgi:hypothetical protein
MAPHARIFIMARNTIVPLMRPEIRMQSISQVHRVSDQQAE